MSFLRPNDRSIQVIPHTKKTVQHRSSSEKQPCGERNDVQYRAYADTDTLSIFFKKVAPGLISHTEDIAPGILADYSDAGQLVSLDLNLASMHTPCHFFDTTDVVNGKQPLALSWDFNSDSDQLTVFLTNEQRTGHAEQTEDPHISMGTDDGGLWQAIIIQNASGICSVRGK
ncbi:hypothetical protein TSOC_014318 [Tetrabaena socialis]|uniref:Uncharacterized protein n=1 Tax=Tetrabaena socialis TaxID=47790 RepID=A0A2J7ZI00_9CHLO|nr:hypothetical protein TSOC_014318 [Tetrabaena socialis]|eukprot:PNG99894.1 hypothetical protein TSOC_014318 [Tetrabaena socialis]